MKAWGKKSLVPMIKQYNNGNIYIPADYLHPKSVSYASKYLVLSPPPHYLKNEMTKPVR